MTSCVALCSFEGSLERSRKASGGHGEGETPLPIPNRAVKPLSADGTWLARAWESRSPPVFPDPVRARHERGRRVSDDALDLEPAYAAGSMNLDGLARRASEQRLRHRGL